MDKSIKWHVPDLTLGLALYSITLSTGSQTEGDFMQSTSAGENSCSLLSKTVVCLYSTWGNLNSMSYFVPTLTLCLISFHSCVPHVMLVLFVCACNSVPHDTLQKRGRKKTFLCAGEKSPREGYASPADDIIKSAWTEKKGRVGVRKIGFKQGWKGCIWMRGNLL